MVISYFIKFYVKSVIKFYKIYQIRTDLTHSVEVSHLQVTFEAVTKFISIHQSVISSFLPRNGTVLYAS